MQGLFTVLHNFILIFIIIIMENKEYFQVTMVTCIFDMRIYNVFKAPTHSSEILEAF